MFYIGWYCTINAVAARDSDNGGQCGPGYYCPIGSAAPRECDPGKYCETAGLDAPTDNCFAGMKFNHHVVCLLIIISCIYIYIIYYRFIVRFLIGLDFLFITFLLHFLLSWTSSLSISCSAISASTLSNHVFLDLPTGLLPSTLYSIHFFTQSSSPFLITCPYHLSIPRLNKKRVLKALAGSSWGQDKENLLMTYNALGKSIANYAAPVWSTNASDSSFKKIQTAQNAALRTATGAHKMASIDHLHQESLTLRVKDHSDMLSAQYLVNCLEEDHDSHGITIQEPRPRPMKETLHSRHLSTVLPRLGSNRMESLQNLHTHAVDSAIQLQGNNRVLKKRPPPISDEEQRLNRRQRCTLSQLRSGHCHLLQDYKHRVFGEPSDICTNCGASPQDVRHLFACTTHPTDLSPEDLWRNPVRSIRAFSYLDNGNLD